MNTQKVAVITGASSGIGKQTALDLIKRGYIVYGCARRVENMKDIEKHGVNILFLDITEEESISTCINTIIDKHQRIDVLINNAGYGSYGAIEDVSLQEAKRQFEVNLFGLARITQLTLPIMRVQKSGKIVNISSIAGKTYAPLGGWYHASKHALEAYSDCLRVEVKPFGIDVIIVEPGLIETEWDTIALDSARNTSGNTVYAPFVEGIQKIFAQLKKPSSPTIISNCIVKAITCKKPQTRYAAGAGAKQVLFLRKLFSDRLYDWSLTKLMNR